MVLEMWQKMTAVDLFTVPFTILHLTFYKLCAFGWVALWTCINMYAKQRNGVGGERKDTEMQRDTGNRNVF